MSQSTLFIAAITPAHFIQTHLCLYSKSGISMETLTLSNDLHLFGVEVGTFPLGIAQAFDSIADSIPNGRNRAYYGLSKMKPDGSILYVAAAEENFSGEAEKYNYKRYTVEKGEYTIKTVHNWMENTSSIMDAFNELLTGDGIDKTRYCVEWYRSDDEVVCMVKTVKDSVRI